MRKSRCSSSFQRPGDSRRDSEEEEPAYDDAGDPVAITWCCCGPASPLPPPLSSDPLLPLRVALMLPPLLLPVLPSTDEACGYVGELWRWMGSGAWSI